MHLGMIGGIGPAATVFYYEELVKAFAEAEQDLILTIGNASARTLSENNSAGRAVEQAEIYKGIADQLAAAGAEELVISSMGGHFCADEFLAISPIPIIDGPSAVGAYLQEQGIRRIGILGTRVVMETGLYGALSELDPIAPEGDGLTQVNDDYVATAIAGGATQSQAERLINAGRTLVREQGAEAVLLGGTDLNLVYGPASVDFPVVDSALVHVRAVAARALAST